MFIRGLTSDPPVSSMVLGGRPPQSPQLPWWTLVFCLDAGKLIKLLAEQKESTHHVKSPLPRDVSSF